MDFSVTIVASTYGKWRFLIFDVHIDCREERKPCKTMHTLFEMNEGLQWPTSPAFIAMEPKIVLLSTQYNVNFCVWVYAAMALPDSQRLCHILQRLQWVKDQYDYREMEESRLVRYVTFSDPSRLWSSMDTPASNETMVLRSTVGWIQDSDCGIMVWAICWATLRPIIPIVSSMWTSLNYSLMACTSRIILHDIKLTWLLHIQLTRGMM